MLEISSVKVYLLDQESKIKAFAAVVLFDSLAIHGIKIIDGPNGLFVAMPSRRNKDGSFSDIVHPINSDCRRYLVEGILQAYEQARNECAPGERLFEFSAAEMLPKVCHTLD